VRAEAHLRIGRTARGRTSLPTRREEAIFEIVNQLNRGAALDHRAEREREQTGNNSTCSRGPAGRQGRPPPTRRRSPISPPVRHCWRRIAGPAGTSSPSRWVIAIGPSASFSPAARQAAADERLVALSDRARRQRRTSDCRVPAPWIFT